MIVKGNCYLTVQQKASQIEKRDSIHGALYNFPLSNQGFSFRRAQFHLLSNVERCVHRDELSLNLSPVAIQMNVSLSYLSMAPTQ